MSSGGTVLSICAATENTNEAPPVSRICASGFDSALQRTLNGSTTSNDRLNQERYLWHGQTPPQAQMSTCCQRLKVSFAYSNFVDQRLRPIDEAQSPQAYASEL